MQDYYEVLGVRPDADFGTIQRAYLQRAKECHPDRGGTHQQMLLLNKEWEILRKPESRKRYDATRAGNCTALAVAAAQADADAAWGKAQDYPRRWADFKKWAGSRVSAIDPSHRCSESRPTGIIKFEACK